jgi:hypothetical protein
MPRIDEHTPPTVPVRIYHLYERTSPGGAFEDITPDDYPAMTIETARKFMDRRASYWWNDRSANLQPTRDGRGFIATFLDGAHTFACEVRIMEAIS